MEKQLSPSQEIKPKESKEKKPGYDLPPVSLKKQGGAFDNELLKDQKEKILKGFSAMDEEIEAMNN